jgi:hypothetical protein
VDTIARHADRMSEPVLAHADLLEEFFFQNLPGMGIANLSHDHILLFTTRGSGVVHDLDIRSVPIEPSKADTPLIVDPNAHLSCPVPLEDFEPIAGGLRRSSTVAAASTWRSFRSYVSRVTSPAGFSELLALLGSMATARA